MKSLDEMLKEWAEEYATNVFTKEGLNIKLHTLTFTAETAIDVYSELIVTGANKLKEMLSEGISCERITVYKHPYSNEISHYSYNEDVLLAAQLKIAELEAELSKITEMHQFAEKAESALAKMKKEKVEK